MKTSLSRTAVVASALLVALALGACAGPAADVPTSAPAEDGSTPTTDPTGAPGTAGPTPAVVPGSATPTLAPGSVGDDDGAGPSPDDDGSTNLPAASPEATAVEPEGALPAFTGWRTDGETGGEVGQIAPNTQVHLTDGTLATLEEIADGQPLLIYFFETW